MVCLNSRNYRVADERRAERPSSLTIAWLSVWAKQKACPGEMSGSGCKVPMLMCKWKHSLWYTNQPRSEGEGQSVKERACSKSLWRTLWHMSGNLFKGFLSTCASGRTPGRFCQDCPKESPSIGGKRYNPTHIDTSSHAIMSMSRCGGVIVL